MTTRRSMLGLIAVAPLAAAEDPAPRGRVTDDLKPGGALDRLIAERAGSDQFSGTVLLTHRGRPVLHRWHGMANRQLSIPNGPDTLYALASVAKLSRRSPSHSSLSGAVCCSSARPPETHGRRGPTCSASARRRRANGCSTARRRASCSRRRLRCRAQATPFRRTAPSPPLSTGSSFGHGGGSPGASTTLDVYPDSVWNVVLLSNYEMGTVRPLAELARKLITNTVA